MIARYKPKDLELCIQRGQRKESEIQIKHGRDINDEEEVLSSVRKITRQLGESRTSSYYRFSFEFDLF